MERDQKWLEHQIHDDDETGEDKDFVFNLFAQEVPYETMEYEFPNVPKISIQSQTETPTSTGLALWLGSEKMCGYLTNHPELVSGKKVLELGAGVGLCGIIASHLNASRVVLTDGDTSVLTNLRKNIEDNTVSSNTNSITSRQLIWGKNLDQFEKIDVILAADCVYMNQSLGPLFKTVDHLLKSDGLLIYVNFCASQAPLKMVLDKANTHGLIWTQPEEKVYLFRRKEQSA